MTSNEYYQHVLGSLEERLDKCIATTSDNPIYEEHDSRAIYNYIMSIKVLKEMLKNV